MKKKKSNIKHRLRKFGKKYNKKGKKIAKRLQATKKRLSPGMKTMSKRLDKATSDFLGGHSGNNNSGFSFP